jgi:DNA-binding CsgD family transcriptional regulator
MSQVTPPDPEFPAAAPTGFEPESIAAMLDLLVRLSSERTPSDFRRSLLGVGELIPGESVAYGEIAPDRRSMVIVAHEPMLESPDVGEALVALRRQHPVLARWEETGDARPLAVSQLVDRDSFHQTELYQELYRELGIADQLVIPIPLPGAQSMMGVGIGRGHWGFAGQEQRLAGQLQQILYLAAMHQRAEELARATEPLLSSLAAERGTEVLLCDVNGNVMRPDGSAAEQVAPMILATIRQAASEAFSDTDAAEPGGILADVGVTGSEGDETRVRVYAPAPGDALVPVTVTGPRMGVVRAELGRHRLTPRQIDTMVLVLNGATNAGVALELGISERTVEKHVFAAYEKLGARTRMEALLAILK